MFSKSNLISTVVTTLWGFFGGYLLWAILADPYLMNHLGTGGLTPKEHPDFMYLVIGCLLVGLFFSTIYSKMANGNHNASQGAQLGILIGLLIGFGSGIIDFSTAGILDLTGTLVNGVVYVVHFMIMGVLASLIYKKF
ncbi:MAG: hypothetical protein KUG51_00440 [Urechidicola sp.]|nr:hypothetical protein [Urechidicola sp.]